MRRPRQINWTKSSHYRNLRGTCSYPTVWSNRMPWVRTGEVGVVPLVFLHSSHDELKISSDTWMCEEDVTRNPTNISIPRCSVTVVVRGLRQVAKAALTCGRPRALEKTNLKQIRNPVAVKPRHHDHRSPATGTNLETACHWIYPTRLGNLSLVYVDAGVCKSSAYNSRNQSWIQKHETVSRT